MAFKFLAFAAFVAVARAGVLPETYHQPLQYAAPVAKVAYSEAPAVSYSSVSAPVATHGYAQAPISYAAPAQAISYAAPAYKVAAPAQAISYAAPAYKVAAPAQAISYAAPAQAISYAAPAQAISYAAPAYKVAAPVAYAAPVAKTIIAEPEAPAHYDFGYSVNDPHTGDSKSQQESRRGDQVKGSYSLIDSDGTKRTVEYSADDHNGFNAVVHKEPAQVAVKTIAKVAAPVAYAQPISYAAPIAKYAAPLAHQQYYH